MLQSPAKTGAILLAAFGGFVAACGTPTSGASQSADSGSDTAPGSDSPPADWYATAMERHRPLGRIAGKLTTPLPAAAGRDNRFDAAIAHAGDRDSYALLVWHDGGLVLEHYFPPYTAELRPESASMHKSVLGLAVAAAIADGAIGSADDRVGRYIAAWDDDPRGDITIRQLLTMTSGLKPLSRDGGTESDAYKYWYNGADARETLLSLELEHEPGTVFYYQDTVPQLLLMVLESATGSPYEAYLSERLWQRLGADDAFVWRNEADGFPRAQSALMARARDWLRVGLLIKDRGRFAGEQIIAADVMDEATAPSAANPNYGWQLWRGAVYEPQRYYNEFKSTASFAASAPYRAGDFLFFDGFGGQRVYISRSEDLVLVRLGALQFDWDDAVLPNLVVDALHRR
ncbi:MAG: serine hydrolase [Pseudomonadota bacterium]